METFRVQRLSDETAVEVTETVVKTTMHRESDLLRQKAYFESMIAKGQEGLDRVNALLNQIYGTE